VTKFGFIADPPFDNDFGGGGGGATDHGALTGLGDDDHTQYLLADGTRSLTGPLATSSTVDGVDIAARDADLALAEGNITTLSGWITTDVAALATHKGADDHTNYHTDARGDARYLELDGTGAMAGDIDCADNLIVDDGTRSWIKMKGRTGDEINNASYTQTDIFNGTRTGWDPNTDFTETTTAGSQLVTCNFTGEINVYVNIYATSAGARVSIMHRLAVGGAASYGIWNQSYHRNQNGLAEAGTTIQERFAVTSGDTVFLQSQRDGTVTTSATLAIGTFSMIERVR
jgi:hypothetical protein